MAAEMAVRSKRSVSKIDARTILALDSGISSGSMFEPVVAAWRLSYGAAVVNMRVRDIWLVGYSPETTFRLH